MAEDIANGKRFQHYFRVNVSWACWTSIFRDVAEKREPISLQVGEQVRHAIITEVTYPSERTDDTSVRLTGYYESPKMEC